MLTLQDHTILPIHHGSGDKLIHPIASLTSILPGKNKSRKKRKSKGRSTRIKQIISWFGILIVAAVLGTLIWQFIHRMWVKPPVSSTIERTDMLVKAGEHIQLTVMNGSGTSGVARTFTDFLRARKFDVVDVTNYSTQNVERTFIVDKVGDPIAAEKVAYALGIDNAMIRREIDTNAFLDVAVIIGKDFALTAPMR